MMDDTAEGQVSGTQTADVEVEAYAEPDGAYAEEYVEGDDFVEQDYAEDSAFKVADQGEDGMGDERMMLGGEGDEGELDESKMRRGLNPLDALDGYSLLVAMLVVNIIAFVAGIVAVANLEEADTGAGLAYWALSGPLLSIITVVVMLVLKKCNEALSVKISPFLSIWLLILWVVIVIPCTFKGPFLFGNGWLGSWGSVICAGTLAQRAFADKAASLQKAIRAQAASETGKWTLFCGAGSVVVMIAASFQFSVVDIEVVGVSYLGYAVSVAVIAILCCTTIMVFLNVNKLKQHSGIVNTVMSIFLAVWWAIGAFVLTFVSPFNVSPNQCSGFNGYFATFGATFAAVRLFMSCGLDFVKSKMASLRRGKGKATSETSSNVESAKDEESPPL